MGVQIQGDTGNVIATKGTYSGDVSIGGTLTYEDVTNIDSVGLITARQGIKIGTGVGVAASISVDGNAEFAGIVTASTSVSTSVKVGGGVTISESGIEASGIGITCANLNGGQIGGRRNLIINGAMMVAQRGTSSTSSGFATLDRFLVLHSGTDESPTQAQVDVASGTTPYTLGFRKSLKVTNGNQTSGAGAADYILINYKTESQDIAKSGWNYTDPNSKITFSYWVKSSVAQNFYVRVLSDDTTKQRYAFETGSLTADTWTKITKTIPGNSNLVFNNDNGIGLYFRFYLYRGTDYTDNSVNLNQWVTHDSSQNAPDNTTTWYTTNDSTWEITGVQLEVGSQATPFEHRSFGEELQLCKRYYQQYINPPINGIVSGTANRTENHAFLLPVEMRSSPTLSISNTGNNNGQRIYDGSATKYITSLLSSGKTATHLSISYNLSGDLTNHRPALAIGPLNTDDQTTFKIDAEL